MLDNLVITLMVSFLQRIEKFLIVSLKVIVTFLLVGEMFNRRVGKVDDERNL